MGTCSDLPLRIHHAYVRVVGEHEVRPDVLSVNQRRARRELDAGIERIAIDAPLLYDVQIVVRSYAVFIDPVRQRIEVRDARRRIGL